MGILLQFAWHGAKAETAQSWQLATNFSEDLAGELIKNHDKHWRMMLPGISGSLEEFVTQLADGLRPRKLGAFAIDVALKSLVQSLPGDTMWLEFGVFQGASMRKIAARANLLQARGITHKVAGFDSFRGLPESWRTFAGVDLGSATFAERVRTEKHMVKGSFNVEGRVPDIAGAEFVVGWFNETLLPFLARESGKVSFLHIDCDLYSSTSTVLSLVGPRLTHGAVIVFDDLLNHPGFRNGEMRALYEWVQSPGFHSSGFTGLQLIGFKGPFLMTDDAELAHWIKVQGEEWQRFPQDALFRVW